MENVTSSIRFKNSTGPLKVIGNEALNSGRNFFQCDKCTGGGIRINDNSMHRVSSFGSKDLEDWISLVESEGIDGDWIQVKHNRAWGHSNSQYGSFILLGDASGEYQRAEDNIGVMPGQVGIGAAGGVHIEVKSNKMYSNYWTHSNVAFYSQKRSSPCGDHRFTASATNPNKAHWINTSGGGLNRAWSDSQCGITNTQIRNNVIEDTTMGSNIWSEW